MHFYLRRPVRSSTAASSETKSLAGGHLLLPTHTRCSTFGTFAAPQILWSFATTILFIHTMIVVVIHTPEREEEKMKRVACRTVLGALGMASRCDAVCMRSPEYTMRGPACSPPLIARCCMCETILYTLLAGLLAEGRVPSGDVIDAGCGSGHSLRLLACLDRSRAYHCWEPIRGVKDRVNSTVARWGLGEVTIHGGSLGERSSVSKHRQAVDDLYIARGRAGPDPADAVRRLGLAAWDVEGAELRVVEGAARTLQRDAPLLVLELHVHQDEAFSTALLAKLRDLAHDVYVVQEVCGERYDCRNLLAVPRRRREAFEDSPVLGSAVQGRLLLPIPDERTLLTHASTFPCCRKDGGCPLCQRNAVWTAVNASGDPGAMRVWHTRDLMRKTSHKALLKSSAAPSRFVEAYDSANARSG